MASIYRRTAEFVARSIGNRTLLVRTAGGTADLGQVFTLEGSGQWLLGLMDGQRSLEEIRALVLAESDADPAAVAEDLAGFVSDLLEIGAIAPVRAAEPAG